MSSSKKRKHDDLFEEEEIKESKAKDTSEKTTIQKKRSERCCIAKNKFGECLDMMYKNTKSTTNKSDRSEDDEDSDDGDNDGKQENIEFSSGAIEALRRCHDEFLKLTTSTLGVLATRSSESESTSGKSSSSSSKSLIRYVKEENIENCMKELGFSKILKDANKHLELMQSEDYIFGEQNKKGRKNDLNSNMKKRKTGANATRKKILKHLGNDEAQTIKLSWKDDLDNSEKQNIKSSFLLDVGQYLC